MSRPSQAPGGEQTGAGVTTAASVTDDSVDEIDMKPQPRMSAALPDKPDGSSIAAQKHQRLVFTDPVAFRYLEEDPSITVLERRRPLPGYEIYIVEQWACSRAHPTFVINTYTGDLSQSAQVGVLSVPADEQEWSARLKVYYKAVSQNYARRRDTPLGSLMVTNLSSFPSALTVIPVPDGNIRSHRNDFIVNENLKRLGCSGRAGLTLSEPNSATKAKFYQLYRTSDRIPFYDAVMELVKLCQVALMMFSKLPPEYVDGLLCDVTEKAVNDWWADLGTELYNMEPNDGILGPTTVAALLGALMGARNRLNAYGAPVAKDAFDINSLKRGIDYFQKNQKIPRTRRLDRRTLDRLHRVTAKVASKEGWIVSRNVKSTVAELGGKGGEMVMGMVGAKEKAGIGDVETLDIETFVQLVHGSRSKWLWYGKPRKSGHDLLGISGGESELNWQKDEQGKYVWSNRNRDSMTDEDIDREVRKPDPENLYTYNNLQSQASLGTTDREQHIRRAMIKSVTGKVDDARSGLERIKDAVGRSGFRRHHMKRSKESRDMFDFEGSPAADSIGEKNEALQSSQGVLESCLDERKREDIFGGSLLHANKLNPPRERSNTRDSILSDSQVTAGSTLVSPSVQGPAELYAKASAQHPESLTPADRSAADVERKSSLRSLSPAISKEPGLSSVTCKVLNRSHSLSHLSDYTKVKSDEWFPRRMSFSGAEEAILTWDDINWSVEDIDQEKRDPLKLLISEQFLAEAAKNIKEELEDMEKRLVNWMRQEVDKVEEFSTQASKDQEALSMLYYQRLEEFEDLKAASKEFLEGRKAELVEAVRDIEVLNAKLEYELGALASKIDDVEDGVAEFERQVQAIESRAQQLADEQKPKENWIHWCSRLLTGIGHRPTMNGHAQ